MPANSRQQVLRETLVAFQDRTIALATGGGASYEEWERARDDVLSLHELLSILPSWISEYRFGGQFWPFIKAKSPHYEGRRQFIWAALAPVFTLIENGATQPTSVSLEPYLKAAGSPAIRDAWSRIQARRETDPEGAITAARTLLESVCKFILDELKVSYGVSDDLPQLYGKVADAMSLGPQNHKEQVFKQILGGCVTVANGIASLRNTFGDAHGKGKAAPKPGARHADLAINLSGAISSFLMATFEERHKAR